MSFFSSSFLIPFGALAKYSLLWSKISWGHLCKWWHTSLPWMEVTVQIIEVHRDAISKSELPQSWVEDRRQHPFKWTSLMPCSCMALNIYKGWQRSSSPQTVTFLYYNNCIRFLKLPKCFVSPFGYILKYLLMLAVPIKNSLFGTLVAQHRTQVSGLETAVSAMGQDTEFSYSSFSLNGI